METPVNTLNRILIRNLIRPSSNCTAWVAGFVGVSGQPTSFYVLQGNGTFGPAATVTRIPFHKVSGGMDVQVPDVVNTGNNRLVFAVTPPGAPPPTYPISGYTAYPFPFPGRPGECPPGPYDIFEFGPNAQYDVSAVDSFGLNLSFTVEGDPNTYGVVPALTRKNIHTAYSDFTKTDAYGPAFKNLLYTGPTAPGFPPIVDEQFSAIVSPKDWLAIFPSDELSTYWKTTVDTVFTDGNRLDLFLNAATVGNYTGSCDGSRYVLSNGSLQVTIPRKDFEGDQPFRQAVPPRAQTQMTHQEYAVYGQIEAAMFQAFSRGVILDGVIKKGASVPANYSSSAWTNTANWFTNHPNQYDGSPSVYDAYAKFMHDGRYKGQSIFGKNPANVFGMAYGFSLDENPNVGQAWPASLNVPSKPVATVGSGTKVILTIGPWS